MLLCSFIIAIVSTHIELDLACIAVSAYSFFNPLGSFFSEDLLDEIIRFDA